MAETPPTTQDTQDNSPLLPFLSFGQGSTGTDFNTKVWVEGAKDFQSDINKIISTYEEKAHTSITNAEQTIWDFFLVKQSATKLDLKYRATIIEQIKNSGLLRPY
jgi:hypothetical protein